MEPRPNMKLAYLSAAGFGIFFSGVLLTPLFPLAFWLGVGGGALWVSAGIAYRRSYARLPASGKE